MLKAAVVTLTLLIPAMADDSPDGRAELDQGRQQYSHQQFPEALAHFDAAEHAARASGDAALLLECLGMRAAVQRDSGDLAQADRALEQAAVEAAKAYGEASPEVAGVLEEIAASHRAQGRAEPAVATIEKAIKIRDAQTGAARTGLARDLT